MLNSRDEEIWAIRLLCYCQTTKQSCSDIFSSAFPIQTISEYWLVSEEGESNEKSSVFIVSFFVVSIFYICTLVFYLHLSMYEHHVLV